MCTWWMARSAGNLRLRLVCGLLLLLLGLFRPGRHDPVHARVGDGLAEVLAKMSRDHEEGTAQGGLPVEHLWWLIGIGVADGHEGNVDISERNRQSSEGSLVVVRKGHDGFGIESRRSGGTQRPGNAI